MSERCLLFSLLLRPARPARAGHVRGNYEEGARPETFSILVCSTIFFVPKCMAKLWGSMIETTGSCCFMFRAILNLKD